MEKYLRKMLDVAESIGSVKAASMGDWISGKERISFTGKTEDGMDYELELTVERKKDDGDDRD